VVCAQASQTCASDLNPGATSGEDAVVVVHGVTGTLTASNTGGINIARVTTQNEGTSGGFTTYDVTYTTTTGSAGSDTLTIHDSGTNRTASIPVSILTPGDDGGPDYFVLDTTSGTACPGQQVTFGTETQGGAPITLRSSDSTLITINQSSGPTYVLNIIRAGSSFVTAISGSATVVYPANIPVKGFIAGC
jgi:hypothetical protein